MAANQKLDPAQEIKEGIIAHLETGTMQRRRPWKIADGGVALRYNGKREGINSFLLGLRPAMMGYSLRSWMTFAHLGALLHNLSR